jgi:homocysteine S-methyltransferase
LLDALEAMAGETDKPLSAMPSGGMPARGRGGFPCSPRYLAQSARRAVAAGASLIGGCCGTTADHIYEMRGAIAELPHAANRRGTAARNPGGAPSPESAPVPMAQRSALGAKLAAGEFAVLVEILPPRGLGSSPEVDQATEWGGLVVTPEIGGSRVRAETACHLFQQVTGGEAVLAGPFALRPEAVRSQLLDACACGVRNILATGPHAAAAAAVADRLNRSGALGGSALLVGVEGDEVPAAGCDYLVTPPLFSVAALEAVAGRVSGVPVIATIRPLASLRDAEFVVNELGAAVPEELLERMRRAGTGDAARAEGLAIAGELAAAIRPLAAGLRLLSCGGDARAAIEIGRALAPRDD